MRGQFFDFDPLTGVVETYEETPDGQGHIHTYQDVTPYLDTAQRLRNESGPDDAWKKTGTTTYAILPLSIVGQMLKKGINIFDQNDMPRVIQEVNTNYANFKTTYKRHELRDK